MSCSHCIIAIPNLPKNAHVMLSSQTVSIRPPEPPIREKHADMFHAAAVSPNPVSIEVNTARCFAGAKAKVEALEKSGKIPSVKGSDVVILPLGTASALPTKYRNGKSVHRCTPSLLLT